MHDDFAEALFGDFDEEKVKRQNSSNLIFNTMKNDIVKSLYVDGFKLTNLSDIHLSIEKIFNNKHMIHINMYIDMKKGNFRPSTGNVFCEFKIITNQLKYMIYNVKTIETNMTYDTIIGNDNSIYEIHLI